MNIVRENIDDLNALVKIKLGPEDYEAKVENRLRDLRKNAKVPGFRQGHVPIGMIKKMAVISFFGSIFLFYFSFQLFCFSSLYVLLRYIKICAHLNIC